MTEILFSHYYPKLHFQKEAELIAVRILNKPEDWNEELAEYDTKFRKGLLSQSSAIEVYEDSHYPVPDGKLLQLVFIGDKHIPFCTLRSWNKEKEKYYRGLIGQILDVVVKDD